MKVVMAHVLSTLLILCSWPLQAGIQLDSTRIIYPAGKREVTLGLTNHSPTPRLIQAWVDADEDNPAAVPFIVMPPIFRLDAHKGQSLRIIYSGDALAQDRESVFWINVLEVRPKRANASNEANAVKVSIRSRLKLFYRPEGLPDSPEKAVSLLHWRIVPDGSGYAIECKNPGAYNVSFNDVGLKGVSEKENKKQNGMCPAMGNHRFRITGNTKSTDGQLMLTVIDDFGGYHYSEANYQHWHK